MRPVILIDMNVVIDLLAKREPFWHSTASIFNLAEQQKIDATINALTLVTVYYILHSYYKIPHRTIIDAFVTLTSYVRVADVTAQHSQLAMESAFNDFEDAVIFYSAKSIDGITCIITRNTDDFSAADIPVLTPDQWLSTHSN